jgi:hypothetical protein
MAELQFEDAAAAGYDRLIGPVSRQFIPILLRAARIGLGMRVLDVATGTGLAAEAALAGVGLVGLGRRGRHLARDGRAGARAPWRRPERHRCSGGRAIAYLRR